MGFEDERTGTWHAYGRTSSAGTQSPLGHDSFRDLYSSTLLKPTRVNGASRFVDVLAAHFPEVVAGLDESDFGILHLEVGALMRATREAIQKRDWAVVEEHFAFVDAVLETAGKDLHDAVGVSYLGNLFFGETSLNFAKARTLLPRRLGVALEIIERHYEELTFRWRNAA